MTKVFVVDNQLKKGKYMSKLILMIISFVILANIILVFVLLAMYCATAVANRKDCNENSSKNDSADDDTIF